MDVSFATAPHLHPALAPYIRHVMGARLHGASPARALELPVAGTAVIVELSPVRWRIGVDVAAPLEAHTSFAGGLTLAPAVSEHPGAYELVEFVLTPAGTAAVLGVPGAALADEVVGLEDLLGAEAERLADRLASARSWAARFGLVERWLLARIGEPPLPPDVSWALRRLDETGGRLPIARVQTELGCSRRHLATRFAQAVGTTPKAYAQLVRFSRAADRLRAGEAPAAVAAACGYADQAHLTRHVRRFGATTPAALRTRVTNVQDGAVARA